MRLYFDVYGKTEVELLDDACKTCDVFGSPVPRVKLHKCMTVQPATIILGEGITMWRGSVEVDI